MLKVGMRVRPIENHPYLGITRRHVGTIVGAPSKGDDTTLVKFKNRASTTVFQACELKAVGK